MSIELHVAGLMIVCVLMGIVLDETVRMIVEWRKT